MCIESIANGSRALSHGMKAMVGLNLALFKRTLFFLGEVLSFPRLSNHYHCHHILGGNKQGNKWGNEGVNSRLAYLGAHVI